MLIRVLVIMWAHPILMANLSTAITVRLSTEASANGEKVVLGLTGVPIVITHHMEETLAASLRTKRKREGIRQCSQCSATSSTNDTSK